MTRIYYDDEETETESESESESKSKSEFNNETNFFLYTCGCDYTFMIEGNETAELSKHRKTCSKLHSRSDDDYNKIKSMYRTEKIKDVVKGFKVDIGTTAIIVAWLNLDYFKEDKERKNVDLKIIEFFRTRLRHIEESDVRKNLRDWLGPLSDEKN